MKLSLCLIQRQLYHDERKNIQIPTDLFLNLCNYHLAGIRSPEQDQRIQQGLQNKLDAVKRRSDYHQKRDAYDKKNI
mgnify:CR=1 FL=1